MTTVTAVIGQNVRALRRTAGLTLDQVAAAVSLRGLPWSSGRVADLESGRMAPMNVDTLLALAAALSDALGRSVPLAELLATSEAVTLTERLRINGAALAQAMTGQPVVAEFSGKGDGTVYPWREADRRICQSLGVTAEAGRDAMYRLWGHPFSVERDTSAEPGANAQRLGIISRGLIAQLKTELTNKTKTNRTKTNERGRHGNN
jgi:transcriptional regulator with XRE-family HTH domain